MENAKAKNSLNTTEEFLLKWNNMCPWIWKLYIIKISIFPKLFYKYNMISNSNNNRFAFCGGGGWKVEMENSLIKMDNQNSQRKVKKKRPVRAD
jgi:hypothetical protein